MDVIVRSRLSSNVYKMICFRISSVCYESDIHKAQESEHEYFTKLIENLEESKKDLDVIKIALAKIKQYSE